LKTDKDPSPIGEGIIDVLDHPNPHYRTDGQEKLA
jgi:hypothetical protein